uniref:Uncharacterized protein n=1 Tax=Tetradesmus obliquus TaxID=3088 RepID=A0A383V8G4_TETOB
MTAAQTNVTNQLKKPTDSSSSGAEIWQQKVADADLLEAFEKMSAVLHEQADKIAGRFPVPAAAAAAAAASESPLPFSVDPATPQLAAMTLQEWVLNQVAMACQGVHCTIENPPCMFWMQQHGGDSHSR